jgi:CO/xanthine dehydrogenase Mo-binding subunit
VTIHGRNVPLGVKGLGEGGAIAPPAAIANAVEDALKPCGVKVCDLPLTPELVWRLANHHPEAERRSY